MKNFKKIMRHEYFEKQKKHQLEVKILENKFFELHAHKHIDKKLLLCSTILTTVRSV